MKSTKAILIVGGSGYIGTHLALRLRDKYKVFLSFNKTPTFIEGTTPIPLDVFERDPLKRTMYAIRPEVIVYVAGSNVADDTKDNDRNADRIHAAGAVNILTAADILQPKMIFVSNSYVFDGRKGNYQEKDIVLPGNALGKAKLSAENFIKGRSLNYIIIRSAPVFGRGTYDHPSWLDQVRLSLYRKQRTEVLSSEIHSFAPIFGLIDTIDKAIESSARNKILHYGGLTKLSAYEFCKEFAQRFGYDPSLVLEKKLYTGTMEIPPQDFSLNCTEAVKTLKVDPFVLEKGFDLFEQELVTKL